jgi:hypothetical protein
MNVNGAMEAVMKVATIILVQTVKVQDLSVSILQQLKM